MGERRRKRMGGEWAKRAGERILKLLYPRGANCLCCGDPRRAEEESCLCEKCRERLEALRVPAGACARCLSPLKQGKPCAFCKSRMMGPLERVYAPYRYAAEARALIHAFKFAACGEALALLADAMADALPDRDFACLTPVPLHQKRLRQRGCNQALLLCRALSVRTGIPTEELLRRDRYQRPQSRTPLKMREKNVEGAFSCAGNAEGKRVLLVDDVRTTGSTARACAQALKDAGAEAVSLLASAVVYRKSG